jgi:hypothetical protein
LTVVDELNLAMTNIMLILKKARFQALALLFAASVALSACYPSPGGVTVDDLDVVATVFNPEVTFSGYRTFAMPDSVVHLLPEDADPDDDNISRAFDELILREVAKGLVDMGYTRVLEPDPNDPPDLYAFVNVTTTQWAGYVGYPWWGGWGWYPGYPPGWGPGWGPGYPWYGGGAIYSYETGTLFVDLVDPERQDAPTLEIGTTWIGALNGLLESSSAGTSTRLTTGIRQMYTQSPYLAPGS